MTQTTQLLRRLECGPITSLEALHELAIARAGARVWELRRDGYDIRTQTITVENRYGKPCHVARYSLAPGQQCLPWPQPEARAA